MIKIKWNNMTPEQKLYVKESAMTIMDKGIHDIIKEPNHIKDAIARIIVEVIDYWPWNINWIDLLKPWKNKKDRTFVGYSFCESFFAAGNWSKWKKMI